jgi:hypothetical protein
MIAAGTRADRPRVIYVMGAGRSGSTIFGVTLGNCAELFYAGELDAWLVRSGAPQLDDAERARFWAAVRADVDGAAALFGNEAQRYLERSLALLRVYRWPARRRLRVRYRRVAEELYRAVAGVSGASHVIDTSHYPLRARELQALDGIDLYLVYLVRDPQSVVASFNRRDVAQYSKSTLTTNAYLWLTNLLAVRVFLRHRADRRLLVHYEDFVADPARALRRVLELVDAPVALPDLTELDTGLAFQGNRVLRSRTIALRGEADAPSRSSRLTALAQLPWSVLLGRLRPSVATSSAAPAPSTGIGARGSWRASRGDRAEP